MISWYILPVLYIIRIFVVAVLELYCPLGLSVKGSHFHCMSPKRPENELSGLINSSSIKIEAITPAGSSFDPITLIQIVLPQ